MMFQILVIQANYGKLHLRVIFLFFKKFFFFKFIENLRQNFFHNNNSIAPFNSFSKLSYNNLKLKFEPLTNVIKPLDNLNENKIIDSVLSTTKSILVPINNNNKFNVKEKNLTNTNSIEKFTTKNSGKKIKQIFFFKKNKKFNLRVWHCCFKSMGKC